MTTLQVRSGDRLQELDPTHANRGFTELREVTFRGPTAPKCRLLIDDEPLSRVGPGNEWVWMPGFYAGEVRAELLDHNSRTLGIWRLDVSSDPAKAGRQLFAEMINAIIDFDAHLVVGEEPARRRLGALGETEDPLVWLERLRRRRNELNQALVAIRREPVSVLKARRRFVPLRDARRTDLRTLQSAMRQPATLVAIRPGTGARLRSGPADGPVLDVPAVERTLDAPANRCALFMLRALLLRCRELTKVLDNLAERRMQETRTGIAARVHRWKQILGEMEREFAKAERRPPFSEVQRAEVTAAGLNAVASHPLYGRFWRVGWEALRRGVYHLDPEDLLPLSPTWEIYERWCFVALARKLREWLPDYAWSNTGTTGSDRRRVIGRRSDGHQITLHLQKTFQRKDGVEQTEAWSISRQCVPDLVLKSETGDGATRFVVLDAKYRTGEQNILNGMAESAHLYHDALRWGPRRPERALLLVPNADETEWLSREDYVNKHHVGVVALRPDIEWPEWLRNLITAHPALAPRSSATDS